MTNHPNRSTKRVRLTKKSGPLMWPTTKEQAETIDGASTEWQVSGAVVFRLKPTGRYVRGEEEMANAFTIRVEPQAEAGTNDADAKILALWIAAFLRGETK